MREEVPLFEIGENHPHIAWLVAYLHGRDWTKATAILAAAERPVNEGGRRWVRRLADKSRGRIAGGQEGYKLVLQMTAEEYHHWRNWMKSQADKMTARILEGDRVFYRRQPVATATGILTPSPEAELLDYAI